VCVVVTNLGVVRGNPDRVQSEVRSDFVAQTPETLIYDADGNLVRDGRWVYSWDAENRLLRVMSYGAADRASWRRVDWAYDALGRRTRQTTYVLSNGVWVVVEDLKFVSDPVLFGRHIAELNATNLALVRSYVWGLDLSETMDGAGGVGGLLWVNHHSGPNAGAHFCAYDGNGNIVGLIAASDGSQTAHYEYGPFGEPIRHTGPIAEENPFGFSTKRTDNSTDLVLYEYRVYSPNTGWWLSRDPIEELGGRNLHGFVLNDPLNKLDGDGRAIVIGIPIAVLIKATAEAAAVLVACAAAKAWLETPQGKQAIHDIVVAATNLADAIARAVIEADKRCSRCLRRTKGCLPCVPPVGTIMGKVDPNPGHGVDGPHVDLYLVMQSPYPECRCFLDRHFAPPVPGSTLPPGIQPVRPVVGGGPMP
jgi:RHS repeat-associated protein